MMFEQLVESEPEGAEFRNRRSYFMVSSVVVGILFATAVVISIYAADFSIGNAAFELVEMVAPPEMIAVEPEVERPRQSPSNANQTQLPTRRVNMLRPDENPLVIPITTSVIPNSQAARPLGAFVTGQRFDSDPGAPAYGGRRVSEPSSAGPATLPISKPDTVVERDPETVPPPVIKKTPLRVSGGALTGKATSLPTPHYPAAAKAVGAQGIVNVQVVIDEHGRVMSATAASGNPLLRPAAEEAARKARFNPTTLSGVPVQVTGIITYNFTR